MISFTDGGHCRPSNHTKSYLDPVNDHPEVSGSNTIGSDTLASLHILYNKFSKVLLDMQIFRVFVTLAASDNPLASAYSSDNFFPTFSHAPRYLCKFSAVFIDSLIGREICNIPTFPLAARRFSQPGFGWSGGVGDEMNRVWIDLCKNNKNGFIQFRENKV